MGKNEMGSPMNASMQSIKDKSDVEFGTGNVPDTRVLKSKNHYLKPNVLLNQQKTVVTLNSF